MTQQQSYENLLVEIDAKCVALDDSDENQAEAASALRVAAQRVREAMSYLDLDDNLVLSSV